MFRSFRKIGLFVLVATGLLYACKKYKDPAPYNDPRLTNPYCNDPDAINYNWGFPGKPDNSVCIYAVDEMKGSYILKDSVVVESSALLVGTDSINIYLTQVGSSKTKMDVSGFCSSGSLMITTGRVTVAAVDTTVGDSLTSRGQLFCRVQDTVTGTFILDPIDKQLLHVSLRIKNDTTVLILVGDARKQ
jgi:hypothetical protein